MTGNRSNITIFLQSSIYNNLEFMQLTNQGPFQIINSNSSKQENNAKGHQWPKQQLIKYSVYLTFQHKLNQSGSATDFNGWPFFRKLSIFVQSKNPNQCRIFHKKMMTDHCSIGSLVSELKSTVHKFQEWYHHYEPSLNNLKTCLNRQREESLKEPTKKAISIKQQIKLNSIQVPANTQMFNDDKKNEDLIPTNTEYLDDAKITSARPVYFPQMRQTRPSFSLFTMNETGDINDDLAFFNSKPAFNYVPFAEKRAVSFSGTDEKWRDCQNSFMTYMGKLNNIMSSSLQTY